MTARRRSNEWNPTHNMHDRVEHPTAYSAATQGRIRARTYAKHVREAPALVIDFARPWVESFRSTMYDDYTDEEIRVEVTDEMIREEILGLTCLDEAPQDFVRSLLYAYARFGRWTERQEAAVRKSIQRDLDRQAQREAERAAASDAPTGKVTVAATVLKIDWRDNPYSYGRTGREVMTIKTDEGWMAWGSVPRSLSDWNTPLEKGARITFTATFTPSEKDPKFAFFKRPTKAARIEENHND